MTRKLFGTVILLSLTGYGAKLGTFCVKCGNETITEIANQIDAGTRSRDELSPIFMVDVALRLGVLIAECENDLRMNGDVAHDTLRKILRIVCKVHDWAQNTMRVLDWVAVYLARRLQFSGIDAARISELAKNDSEEVEDYLDLVR